jgi:hypothetical protein
MDEVLDTPADVQARFVGRTAERRLVESVAVKAHPAGVSASAETHVPCAA